MNSLLPISVVLLMCLILVLGAGCRSDVEVSVERAYRSGIEENTIGYGLSLGMSKQDWDSSWNVAPPIDTFLIHVFPLFEEDALVEVLFRAHEPIEMDFSYFRKTFPLTGDSVFIPSKQLDSQFVFLDGNRLARYHKGVSGSWQLLVKDVWAGEEFLSHYKTRN